MGVEGIKDDIILDSLKKAGCTIDGSATAVKEGREITKADLYKAGLSGERAAVKSVTHLHILSEYL